MNTPNKGLAEAQTTHAPSRRSNSNTTRTTLERLDYIVLAVIGVLLGLTTLVILGGDRVGITIRRTTPQGVASSQASIQIAFDESIDPASVNGNIQVSPQVTGRVSVDDYLVSFTPDKPLSQGQVYQVTVGAGVRSVRGRSFLTAQSWEFRVRPAYVIYLSPASSPIQNLSLIDPDAPAEAQNPPEAITRTENGILSYDISRDGSRIVFAQLEGQGKASLYTWDARTNTIEILVDCPDAACTNPAWQPDGNMVAFERTDLNTTTGLQPGVSRVWLYDAVNFALRPVFADSQRIGYSPRWSPDGSKLALYDASGDGIIIYSIATGATQKIDTPQGDAGLFSPDGRWIAFPKIVSVNDGAGNVRYVSHIVLADLSGDVPVQRDLLPDSDPNSDVEAMWSADSTALYVARRLPPTATGGGGVTGALLYRVEIATGEAVPLLTDAEYSNGGMVLDPSGERLAFQRFAIGQPGGRVEIWTLDLATRQAQKLVVDGSNPRWLP
jgi:Tol biopolymer transport system component